MTELRGPDEFPRGKGPEANFVQADVTTANDAEIVINTIYCQHIKKHQPVVLFVTGTLAAAAGSARCDIDIVAGNSTGAADIGEASEALVTAAKDHTFIHMVYQAAYQDKPVYSATIKVDSASANCTIQSSCLTVTPVVI